MNNQFKNIAQETPQEDLMVKEELEATKPQTANIEIKEGSTTAFLRKLFTEGVITKETATDILPFIIFLCVLVMLYIANSHMAIKNIRKIGGLSKDVKELSWEYKSLKAELMFKSKPTEVAKRVDTLGIKELIEPPKKLIVEK